MNEVAENVAVENVQPKAAKPTKPKAKPKAKSTKPKPKAAKPAGISGSQHRILVACSKKPHSRKMLSEKVFGGNSVNFAPLLGPLVEAKLLREREVDVDGRAETFFEITAPGSKVAEKAPPTRAANTEHASLPKVGGTIEKVYLGKTYKVTVTAEGFRYGGKPYTSLTAVAKAIRGSDQEVNGWAFFGLAKKK